MTAEIRAHEGTASNRHAERDVILGLTYLEQEARSAQLTTLADVIRRSVGRYLDSQDGAESLRVERG